MVLLVVVVIRFGICEIDLLLLFNGVEEEIFLLLRRTGKVVSLDEVLLMRES